MLTKNFFGIYQENDEGYYSGIQKKQIIQWCGIFIDRITDEVTDRIILSVMPLIIFNLWPDDRPLSPPLPFLLLSYAFFSQQTTTPPPISTSTQFNLLWQIQPPQHSVCEDSPL